MNNQGNQNAAGAGNAAQGGNVAQGGNAAQAGNQNAQNGNQNGGIPRPRLGDIFKYKFAGNPNENPNAHWLEWEDYCELYNLDQREQVLRFKYTLTGNAREWISVKVFRNPGELKESFISYFSGYTSRESAIEAFRGAKWQQGECVERFANKLTKLGRRLNLNDELIREQFLDGFPLDMKTAIIMSGAADLNAMKVKAQRYADLNKERQVQVGHHFAVVDTGMEELRRDMDELKLLTKSLLQAAQHDDDADMLFAFNKSGQFRGRSQLRSNSKTRSNSKGSGNGKTVKYRDPTPGKNTGSVKCWFCGEDHLYSKCRALFEQLSSGKLKLKGDF